MSSCSISDSNPSSVACPPDTDMLSSSEVQQCEEQFSDVTRQSRDKKNDAVRKSRYKTKQKEQMTEIRIHNLVIDNQCLSQTIHSMQMELSKLKETYQQYSLREYHTQSSQLPSQLPQNEH